jgi:antitoxin VapB
MRASEGERRGGCRPEGAAVPAVASKPAARQRGLGAGGKILQVRAWLDETGYDGALFRTQPEVAWVTDGLTDPVVRNEEPGLVWALVTHAEAALITTNIEEPRLRAEESTAGFELHAVPWHSPGGLAQAVTGRAGGLRLASDPDELAVLRMPLTTLEAERHTILGLDTASALESALHSWHPSERECDVAGRIAAALEERLIFPSVLLVGGAGRRLAFRHPVTSTAVTGRNVLAVVVGVRNGLNVACSRTVAAGQPDAELAARHLAACAVETAMIDATRPGATWESAVAAGIKAYAAEGFPDEWRSHVQGGPIGYLSREFDVVPGSARAQIIIGLGDAFAWNPTVRGAKSEDTFVVGADGPVPVTNTANWPVVAGGRPAILNI